MEKKTTPVNVGKVYLVGAGPGDPNLLTLRAKELLNSVEVVAYDALISPSILSLIGPNIELISIGHRGYGLCKRDYELHPEVVEMALRGKNVLRLKSGDPFVFGRGAQECRVLQEHKIPFEIVPGISSALGAAVYTGIPLTWKDHSSDIIFASGHDLKGGKKSQSNWQALSQSSGTLVLYMASCKIEDNCKRLIEFGKKPETPVFYVASATCGNQKLIFGTLENIGQKTKHLGKGSPALIIVGEVGGLKERFDWRRCLPLKNKRLLCLRVRKESSELAKRLRSLGADIIEAPFVEVQPCLKDKFPFEHFKSILFSDMTAVSFFMKTIEKSHKDIRDFGGIDFFVLDNKSEEFLKTFGIKVKLNFSGHCHEAIKDKLSKIQETTFLTLGPKKGRPSLIEFFNKEKREIIYTPIYETSCHFPKIEPPYFDGIIAPSTSSMDFLSHGDWKSLIGEIPIFVMGSKTEERSKELGAKKVLVSKYDSRDSLIEKINETFKDKDE